MNSQMVKNKKAPIVKAERFMEKVLRWAVVIGVSIVLVYAAIRIVS